MEHINPDKNELSETIKRILEEMRYNYKPRDPERLEGFYEKLKTIHKNHFPEQRFGQMIINFQADYGDIFYLEENRFLENFTEWTLKQERSKGGSV